jgi:hypothetical protein
MQITGSYRYIILIVRLRVHFKLKKDVDNKKGHEPKEQESNIHWYTIISTKQDCFACRDGVKHGCRITPLVKDGEKFDSTNSRRQIHNQDKQKDGSLDCYKRNQLSIIEI